MRIAARVRAESMLVEQEEWKLTHRELGERHDISAARVGVILRMARRERKLKAGKS
jgi:hypothetical protein